MAEGTEVAKQPAKSLVLEEVVERLAPQLRSPELVKAICTPVQPQKANSFIKFLRDNIRTPTLSHLKRVRSTKPDDNGPRKLKILVCTEEHYRKDLKPSKFFMDAFAGFGFAPEECLVPKIPPRLAEERAAWAKWWPISYVPPKPKLPRVFSPEEKKHLEGFMERAIEIADKSSKKWGQYCIAAVAVDPSSNEIVGEGVDYRCGTEDGKYHRLHHAVMECIKSVSEWDRKHFQEKLYEVSSDELSSPSRPTSSPTAAGKGGQEAEDPAPSPPAEKPTTEPPTPATAEASKESATASADGAGSKMDVDPAGAAPAKKPASSTAPKGRGKKRKRTASETSESSPPKERKKPYICTSFDLFVTHEPCAMCAMAVLHSRFSRVFYGVPTKKGALGSKWALHYHPRLNHEFQVFKNLCRTKIESLENHPPDVLLSGL